MDGHISPVAEVDGNMIYDTLASNPSLMHMRFLQEEGPEYQYDNIDRLHRDTQQQQILSLDNINQPIDPGPIYSQRTKPVFSLDDLLETFDSGIPVNNLNGAEDVEVSDAMSAIGFNVIIFIMLMTMYEFLSRVVPSVYACRSIRNDPMIIDIPRSILPLSWLPAVIKTNWATVRKYGGLDAYFYLRFIRLCVRITAISGIWAIIVLWPIFASGGDSKMGFYHFSMANLSQGSTRIWFPTIFMWYLTFYVLFAMKEEYEHYLELRMKYLSEGDANINPQIQHSLIIENVPRELRSDSALYRYFDSLFPGKIHSTYAVLNIPDLEKLSAKRKRAVRRLEKSVAYFESTGTRLTHIVGRKRLRCFGIETYPIRNFGGRVMVEEDDSRSPQRGARVDSITYYTAQLVELNELMDKMMKERKTLAAEGNNKIPWISQMIDVASNAAASRLKNSTYMESLVIGFKRRKGICGFIRQIVLDFFFGGLTLFNSNIDDVIDNVSGSSVSSTGFVTFDDLATAACATKSSLSNDRGHLKASLAPDPHDILWDSAHINESNGKGREWTANILLVFGAILWSIPIASIQAFATADRLATVPGFQWMNSLQGGEFQNFINGYLPVVALLALISLLPKIFERIAVVFERRKTLSSVRQSILERLFLYQLANIFITITAGSIWTALGAIINHPGSGLQILATTVPTLVGFFVTLLMTKTLAVLPIVLLRLGPLCKMIFLKLCFKQSLLTQREIDQIHRPEELYHCSDYADQLLVIVICFTYACISPIILPAGALYFLGSLIAYKKQVLLVYSPQRDNGGIMFPSVLRRMLIGLIFGQVTLIGYTIMREAYYQPLVLFPLPVITTLMMHSFTQIYNAPSVQLSLEKAKELDQNSMVKLQFRENFYRQPVLEEGRAEPLPYRVDRRESAKISISTFQNLGVFHDDGKIV